MFLHGDFALISPASLLQVLCQEQRSVTISAWRGLSQAVIQLSEGLIVTARCDSLFGEEAVYRVMAWDCGQFQVSAAPVPAEMQVAFEWESVVLEAARLRDELELELPPLPPLPTQQQIERLLQSCPAVSGIALIGYDGRLLAMAGLDQALAQWAKILAAGLGITGTTLNAVAGRDENEVFPILVSVYADDQPTLLLADWGDATRLLATLPQSVSPDIAARQLRLHVRMMVSSPL